MPLGRQIRWCLRIALAALALYMFCRLPTRAKIELSIGPRVPSTLGAAEIFVALSPRAPLDIIPPSGFIDPSPGIPLIPPENRRLRPTRVAANGLLFEAANPFISFGAQRIVDLSLAIGASDLMPLRIEFDVDVDVERHGPSPEPGVPTVIRPHRDACVPRAAYEGLTARASVRPTLFGTTPVVVDTSPLPLLIAVPRPEAITGALCDSSLDSPASLEGSRVPLAGLDVPFTIEDDLTGPYARPPTVNINFAVIQTGPDRKVPLQCHFWQGKLSRTCWNALAALASRRCARAWPVALDPATRVLHIDYTGAQIRPCTLLIEVGLPGDDAVNAMALSLRSTPQ